MTGAGPVYSIGISAYRILVSIVIFLFLYYPDMKKSLLATLTLSALSILCTLPLSAQCTGGPDPACINSNGPCGSLHDGLVGQYYSDTISFWAPNQVDASAQSGGLYSWVDFVQFHIADVTGLPAGLNWSCGNGSCVYNPQPSGILANMNICGTPFVSGTYSLHVHIIGTVAIPGLGNQNGDQYYDIPLNINTVSGGNPVFSFNPIQACDSGAFTFTPSMSFPSPQITGYYWDFGSGNVSSVTTSTPITVDYNTPGIYPVTCTTSVYNMVLTDLSIDVSGTSWWCGDIEEANCGNGNADIVPTFTTGVTNWTGAEIDDTPTPSWSTIGFILTGTSYSISLVEIDPVSPNDYPAGPVTGTITGIGNYSFNYPNNFSGTFTINAVLASQFIATDTVYVYASPPMDTIVATATSLCPDDSVTLTVDTGYFYQWYLNDTTLVQSGNDNSYTTHTSGNYKVIIIDPVSGCSVTTDPVTLNMLTAIPPGFHNVGITETPPGTYHSILPGSNTYQWLYFDGISYFPIPAPQGTAQDYTPTVNGVYCLIATNSSGCSDTSNCIGFHLGVDNFTSPFMANVYPNPSNGVINISIANLTEEATLNVYDMIGQQVYSVKIMGTGSINEMHDLSFLTKGMYILELRNQQNRYTHKLIIE